MDIRQGHFKYTIRYKLNFFLKNKDIKKKIIGTKSKNKKMWLRVLSLVLMIIAFVRTESNMTNSAILLSISGKTNQAANVLKINQDANSQAIIENVSSSNNKEMIVKKIAIICRGKRYVYNQTTNNSF